MKDVIHENKWPWGRTISIVVAGGAGMVDMSFDKNDCGVCYLSGLSVIPEYRRRGIAHYLMKECELYCRKNNMFRIDLNSVQESFVMDFYHKLGFKDIEERDGFMRMYKLLT